MSYPLSPLVRAAQLIAQARAANRNAGVYPGTDRERMPASARPKACVKCGRKIRRPYLADDEPERCARCADS